MKGKGLQFLERVCDLFKVAHGVVFALFLVTFVMIIDSDINFLPIIGVILYSGGAAAFFWTLQQIVLLEIERCEKAEEARVWYLAISDVIKDITLTGERICDKMKP